MKGIEIIRTVHDGDCPQCGFPETVIVRDAKTMTPIWEECGKQKCRWGRKMQVVEERKIIKLKKKK